MESEDIVGAATRKENGWYPVLEFPNGGRLITDIWCESKEHAELEAWEMIEFLPIYPESLNELPKPNQLIDLRLVD